MVAPPLGVSAGGIAWLRFSLKRLPFEEWKKQNACHMRSCRGFMENSRVFELFRAAGWQEVLTRARKMLQF
jgi:hypothetical protein